MATFVVFGGNWFIANVKLCNNLAEIAIASENWQLKLIKNQREYDNIASKLKIYLLMKSHGEIKP